MNSAAYLTFNYDRDALSTADQYTCRAGLRSQATFMRNYFPYSFVGGARIPDAIRFLPDVRTPLLPSRAASRPEACLFADPEVR
jgi:hypothetical protein